MSAGAFDWSAYPIVVAIDFGTTFSGCSYTYVADDNKEVYDVSAWPKQPGKYSKTPTISLYDTKQSKPSPILWGWRAKVEGEKFGKDQAVLQKFKLRLDEKYAREPSTVNVDTIQAIADYLKPFHEYTTESILKGFGDGFSSDKFRYCLTVPAMWSDKAKNAMRQAAIRANLIRESDHLDRLMLVTEPEAAALYCQLKCDQFSLGNKDRFMICDAGGGTVDLIVYEIEETASGKRLSEVTKGHGASCGSIFVDKNFEKLLVDKFASQRVTLPPKVLTKMMEKFVGDLKPLFDGDTELHLDLPSNACFENILDESAIGLDDGVLVLDVDELKRKVFDPVIEQVFGLIDQQLVNAKSCSTIFLVGGFGSSEYLLERVKDKFSYRVKDIFVPPRAEMAVVRGAVFAGINPRAVSARVSRRNYGVAVRRPFRKGIDPISKKSVQSDGEWRSDGFLCVIRKGAKVNIDECVKSELGYTKGVHSTATATIYAFDGDGNPPDYISDEGMIELGEICAPDPFTSLDPSGKKVWLEFKMYFGLNEFKSAILVKGQEYTTTLTFDADDIS